METSVDETNTYCEEIKASIAETAAVLDELTKDRSTWMANFETMQRNHYDKRYE